MKLHQPTHTHVNVTSAFKYNLHSKYIYDRWIVSTPFTGKYDTFSSHFVTILIDHTGMTSAHSHNQHQSSDRFMRNIFTSPVIQWGVSDWFTQFGVICFFVMQQMVALRQRMWLTNQLECWICWHSWEGDFVVSLNWVDMKRNRRDECHASIWMVMSHRQAVQPGQRNDFLNQTKLDAMKIEKLSLECWLKFPSWLKDVRGRKCNWSKLNWMQWHDPSRLNTSAVNSQTCEWSLIFFSKLQEYFCVQSAVNTQTKYTSAVIFAPLYRRSLDDGYFFGSRASTSQAREQQGN